MVLSSWRHRSYSIYRYCVVPYIVLNTDVDDDATTCLEQPVFEPGGREEVVSDEKKALELVASTFKQTFTKIR